MMDFEDFYLERYTKDKYLGSLVQSKPKQWGPDSPQIHSTRQHLSLVTQVEF